MSEVSLRIHSPQWYQQRLHGILMKNKEHSERAGTQTNSLIGFFSEQPLLYDKKSLGDKVAQPCLCPGASMTFTDLHNSINRSGPGQLIGLIAQVRR